MSNVLGSMSFTIKHTSHSLSIPEIQEIIDLYKQNHPDPTIDTATYYNNDHILSQLNLNGINIDTKVNPWFNNDFESGKLGMLSKNNLTSQLTNTLQTLNVDKINTLYLHSPDHDTPIFETLQTCNTLYQQNYFNNLGLSNYSLSQVKEIIEICNKNNFIKPSVYQGLYNPLCRKIEELFPTLKQENIKFYAYNPLAGGLLTGKYLPGNHKNTNSRFFNNSIYQNLFWKDQYLSSTKKLYNKFGDNIINIVYSWFKTKGINIVIGVSSKEQYMSNVEGVIELSEEDEELFDRVYEEIKNEQNYYY
jgi:aflatoxin B1 aldehyde reductase